MPKETFGNLPDEKRNPIIQTAIDEFLTHGYEGFSISRFVEQAKIAKGSFYQYFEGKDDLYAFIIETASQRKLQYLTQITNDLGQIHLFDLLRALYVGAFAFMKEEYELAIIVDRFLKSANSSLKEHILGDSVAKSNRFLEGLIQDAIERGELQENLDIPFTAYVLTSFSVSLGDYARSTATDIHSLDETTYTNLVDQTIGMIKTGILKPPPPIT